MSRQSVIRRLVAQHGLYGCWVGHKGDYKDEIEKQPVNRVYRQGMYLVLVCLGYHSEIPQAGQVNKQGIYFSQFQRLGCLRSSCWQICFLVTALLLVYRPLLSHYVFTWQREEALVSLPFLAEALIPLCMGGSILIISSRHDPAS